jgi:hypothetical protein
MLHRGQRLVSVNVADRKHSVSRAYDIAFACLTPVKLLQLSMGSKGTLRKCVPND